VTTEIALEPQSVIAAEEGDAQVVAFNVGPDLRPYVVTACHPLDYRWRSAGGAQFPKATPERPQKYRVVRFDGSRAALDLTLSPVAFNVHHVQPLGDAILLVCSRSYRRGPQDFDLNAHLFDSGGHLLRSFLLGDGIECVQATAAGTLWTSYFDEGVFGNLGWREPVGASGLVAWSSAGERLYEFAPPAGLDSIADCYALNVASDEVTWCYYYTEFALVRVCGLQAQKYWRVPLAGSRAFAISGEFVLFAGGYDDTDTYTLFQLEDVDRLRLRHRFKLAVASAGPQRLVGRGDALWLQCGRGIYRFCIADALSVSGIAR
jgi:hypothetical protein